MIDKTKDVQPIWYFEKHTHSGWRFFIGRVAGQRDGIKHLCINIGLWLIDFGRGY